MPPGDAVEPPDAEMPFDRVEAREWAKEESEKLRPVVDAAQALLERYKRQAWDAHTKHTHERLGARLRELSVDEMARGTRIRRKALLGNNVQNAQDVLTRGVMGLLEIRNVGEKSARQLVSLAEDAARVQSADMKPPADPSKWMATDFDLVRALKALAVVGTLIGLPHLSVLQQLLAALTAFKRVTNWLRWLFSSRARKDAARTDYHQLRSTAGSTDLSHALAQVMQGLERAQQIAPGILNLSPNETIADWREASADLYARLEDLIAHRGSADERATVTQSLAPVGISQSLVDRIDSIKLDLSLVAKTLRPYQYDGAKFALAVGRGLLGDEMGLGKTIEALAAIAHSISAERREHHIVVCPAVVLDNWLREVRETIPQVKGMAYRGKDRESAMREWQADGGILVSSYDQAVNIELRDLPEVGFLVLDEAFYVKNPSARRTRFAARLAPKAERVLLMGGTLVENRASEMISLSGIANPALEARLRSQFGEGDRVYGESDEFRRAIGDFYLRRNQSEVMGELPEVESTDEPILVGESERIAYKQAIEDRNLARARMALASAGGVRSQKMAFLAQVIAQCRNGNLKVLIFTEYIGTLNVVSEVVGPGCETIRGGMADSRRTQVINDFQCSDGFAALAMQIRVGGVGINLQAASVVVLMEPQYKPSTEWQAVGRAYRMGQTKPVMVYRLIAKDTVEDRIVELTEFKADLFDRIARQSDLADAMLEAHDRMVDPRRLLEEERRRLGVDDGQDG